MRTRSTPAQRLKQDRPEFPPRVFTTALKQELEKRDINAKSLAHALEVTPLTARRIINGCDLKLSVAFKIAELLGLPLASIWQVR